MRLIASFMLALPALAQALSSPDGQLQVDVSVNDRQQLVYAVQRAGQPVLLASRLGLLLEQGDHANGLKLAAASPVKPHRERYTLVAGKNGPREITLDLAWLGRREGRLITDGAGPREFAEGSLSAAAPTLTLAPRGGFVARFR